MRNILCILGIFYFFSSCNVLDVEPEDSIPADEAFKTKAGIERGILGSYSDLQSLSYYGRSYSIFADLAADNLSHPTDATNSDYREVDNNAILPENGAISGIWSIIYSSINTANNVIEKVPGMQDMTDTEKNESLGELYFIRALNHFNLLNYFGAVPVKTKPTVGVQNLDAGRDTVTVVYEQIITDLTFAESHLPASASQKTRASRYAATALLARVYLYQGDYSNASSKSTEVIKSGGYNLLSNFADVFASDKCAESIFEIDFTEVDRNRIAEQNFPKTLNGRREVMPSASILSAYEAGDVRKNVTIAFDGTNAYANKYNDLSLGADNLIILRLGEMYLIRAEAEALKAGGNIDSVKFYLNAIRTRANLAPTASGNLPELIGLIEAERRLELAFEGHRWFDLVRTGRATILLPTVTNINKTLFPIPLSELQTNKNAKMTQNPGYN